MSNATSVPASSRGTLQAIELTSVLIALTTVVLVLFVFATVSPAIAHELRGPKHPPGIAQNVLEPRSRPANADDRPQTKSDQPQLRGPLIGFSMPRLSAQDRRATLAAVQTVLHHVEDGSTYVWYRRNTDLTGLMRPIRSFSDASGRICRVLRITLMSGPVTKTVQGNACRASDGRWSLERS
ncbi:MAG: RT0821/Lpp0805 family surface protein [Pseudomonadota bacterium]